MSEPIVDHKGREVALSTSPCPMNDVTGCPGMLSERFQINDEPQYAIVCTTCSWWTLA